MSVNKEMSEAEYEDIIKNIEDIPSNTYEIKYDSLPQLDKILDKLPKVWKGEAADEYISRMSETRDRLVQCIESMDKVAEDIYIEIENKYTH